VEWLFGNLISDLLAFTFMEGATMSTVSTRRKITTKTIRARKGKTKITSLTAYDYPTAKLVDESGVDVILVGDSLGMVVLGYPDTTHVTVDDMVHHTKAVSRAKPNALLVADLPFLSFGITRRDTIYNAGRLIREGGAEAVKLEGGERVLGDIRALVECQIPVMGHVGLTPQSVHAFGGFRVQGKKEAEADQVLRDAVAVQEGGAFSVVLEGIPASLGARITREIDIPTIGIGAGPECDGQVLVTHDILNLFQDFTPKFVKVYADLGNASLEAMERFGQEVRDGIFPTDEHSF
jgi:3-methyl-2-oxobutanoate hydroxymethyltransferase